MITLDQFNKLLEQLTFEDYLVTIASKHLENEEWHIHNEVLTAEISGYAEGPQFVWLDDWYEGEEFIFIVGLRTISSIALPNIDVDDTPEVINEMMNRNRIYYHQLIRNELDQKS